MQSLTVGVLPVFIPLLVLREPVIGLGAHWFGKIAEGLGVVQVNFLNPRQKGPTPMSSTRALIPNLCYLMAFSLKLENTA